MKQKSIFSHQSLFLFFITVIFSCEGPEGKMGPAGQNSLLNIIDEPPGVNCVNGGIKVEGGVDKDNNDQLSSDEVNQIKYVCKGDTGVGGKNSLINVVTEPAGTNCSIGGLKIEVGPDNNTNGTLESSEINQTRYVCHGDHGVNSLTIITNEPVGSNCSAGGYKLQVGPDSNSNLTLEPSEIQATKYICSLQADKQIRIEIGSPNFGTNSTEWVLSQYQTYHLIKFNKLDYSQVDSITFVPSMYTGINTNHCYVELFNITDNVSISNSQLQSTTNDWLFFESRNIYDDLPNKEVTLGIRIKTENSNYYVSTGIRSYIFIYKH